MTKAALIGATGRMGTAIVRATAAGNGSLEIVAAIAGLGAIADPGSLDPLLAFLKSVKGATLKGHPQYQPIIDYALHRCRGSQRWRLVKVSKSSYVIEK